MGKGFRGLVQATSLAPHSMDVASSLNVGKGESDTICTRQKRTLCLFSQSCCRRELCSYSHLKRLRIRNQCLIQPTNNETKDCLTISIARKVEFCCLFMRTNLAQNWFEAKRIQNHEKGEILKRNKLFAMINYSLQASLRTATSC